MSDPDRSVAPYGTWPSPLSAADLAAAPSPCLRFSWYASGGFFPGKKRVFSKFWTSGLEKKGAPGRLSRARDLSRSTRAVILRPGMSRGSRIADLEAHSCKIEGRRVPGRASTFFGLQRGPPPPSVGPTGASLGPPGAPVGPGPVVRNVRNMFGTFGTTFENNIAVGQELHRPCVRELSPMQTFAHGLALEGHLASH